MRMDKRIIVSLPKGLYEGIRKIANREVRSVSALIRESLLERIEDELTAQERGLVATGRKAFRQGKGTDWRKVRRG